MDVIDDLAYPLPMLVIAELLGVPRQDRDRFKAWSDAVVGVSGAGGGHLRAEMRAYFLRIIEQRRREPQADSSQRSAGCAGRWAAAQPAGIVLLGFCIFAAGGRNATTTQLIGNALLCFDEQPDVLEACAPTRP